jgi:hypothetical protein
MIDAHEASNSIGMELIDCIELPVLVVDRDLTLVSFNPAAAKLLALTGSDRGRSVNCHNLLPLSSSFLGENRSLLRGIDSTLKRYGVSGPKTGHFPFSTNLCMPGRGRHWSQTAGQFLVLHKDRSPKPGWQKIGEREAFSLRFQAADSSPF